MKAVKLKGTFWAITTYFNYEQYRAKLENFKKFKKHLKGHPIKLLVVELAFGNERFQLKNKDADKLIQVRSNSVLWQKERLLNLGLLHLPKDCDKVAWLDCDIIFQNPDWVSEAAEELTQFPVIQLFEKILFLTKEETLAGRPIDTRPDRAKNGSAYEALLGHKGKGIAGGAWAARRAVITKLGFFDKMILGSADRLMRDTFCGAPDSVFPSLPHSLQVESIKWKNEAKRLHCNRTSYVRGQVLHLYHGAMRNISYRHRDRILKNTQFDANQDLAINRGGAWEWAGAKSLKTKKGNLLRRARRHFWRRNEDDRASQELEIFSYRALQFIRFRIRNTLTNNLVKWIGTVSINNRTHFGSKPLKKSPSRFF